MYLNISYFFYLQDSSRFSDAIIRALDDIKTLFEAYDKQKKVANGSTIK